MIAIIQVSGGSTKRSIGICCWRQSGIFQHRLPATCLMLFIPTSAAQEHLQQVFAIEGRWSSRGTPTLTASHLTQTILHPWPSRIVEHPTLVSGSPTYLRTHFELESGAFHIGKDMTLLNQKQHTTVVPKIVQLTGVTHQGYCNLAQKAWQNTDGWQAWQRCLHGRLWRPEKCNPPAACKQHHRTEHTLTRR